MNKVFLHATYDCNAFCKHCAVPRRKEDMGLDLFKKMIDEIPMEFLVIGGGEPLKHSKLQDMIDYSYEKTKVKIETNGGLLSKKFIYDNKIKLFQINTSIDGLEKTHNSIRGVNIFNKTVEMIKYARDLNMDVAVWSVVMKDNFSEFEEIISLVKDMDVNKLSFLYATPVGKCSSELTIDYSKYNELFEKVKKYNSKELQIRIAPYVFTQKNIFSSNLGCIINDKDTLHIDPKGNIYPCVLLLDNLKYKLGSIQKGYNFMDVYDSNNCEGLIESLGFDDRKKQGIPVCPCKTISREWIY